MNKAKRDLVLELVRSRYGERWRIRRTENLWIATALDHGADHAPTIVQPILDDFVRDLEDPPKRAGGPSMLQAPLFAERLRKLADGVYLDDTPPI
ncbi:hypothetical protein O4J56_09145 [Nocardiopsis sp. RSe5-2]|uniref:Uncharacterized protein n=1 Tax=Nocardiopsis endophytica TaxID=3018445 RepID=A0ABT4U1H0_9ACTN|nr:hypothetical protein [Nocardiopsis endophytica]MDA2810798.1 hypothetical protein [Nocardiopsis endophytica]